MTLDGGEGGKFLIILCQNDINFPVIESSLDKPPNAQGSYIIYEVSCVCV